MDSLKSYEMGQKDNNKKKQRDNNWISFSDVIALMDYNRGYRFRRKGWETNTSSLNYIMLIDKHIHVFHGNQNKGIWIGKFEDYQADDWTTVSEDEIKDSSKYEEKSDDKKLERVHKAVLRLEGLVTRLIELNTKPV